MSVKAAVNGNFEEGRKQREAVLHGHARWGLTHRRSGRVCRGATESAACPWTEGRAAEIA